MESLHPDEYLDGSAFNAWAVTGVMTVLFVLIHATSYGLFVPLYISILSIQVRMVKFPRVGDVFNPRDHSQ